MSCLGMVACAATSPGAVAEAVTSGDGPGGAHVVYLNFGGVAVQPGSDDATQDRSAMVSMTELVPSFDAAPYAPQFTPDQARAAIASQVAQLFAPFNVEVVTVRPATGRYTMAVIGGGASSVGLPQTGASGAASVDCGNLTEPNVVFVFSTTLSPASLGSAYSAIAAVAITTAKEVGRSFGLADTLNNLDVMNTSLSVGPGGTPTATGFAAGLHDAVGACGGAMQQDSAALLAMNIGAAAGGGDGGVVGDAAPPVLDLASVPDESMPLDAALDLATDDLAVHVAPDASTGANGGGCSVGGPVAGDALFAVLALLLSAASTARGSSSRGAFRRG